MLKCWTILYQRPEYLHPRRSWRQASRIHRETVLTRQIMMESGVVEGSRGPRSHWLSVELGDGSPNCATGLQAASVLRHSLPHLRL